MSSAYFLPQGKAYNSIGFLSLATGGDYYYADNKFISIQFGYTAGNFSLTDRFVDSFTIQKESSGSFFVNVRNNYVWRGVDLGYGLLASNHIRSRYQFNIGNSGVDSVESYINTGIGGCLTFYNNFSNHFSMGILYQPQFLSISDGISFKYEHTLSLDLLFKITVKKKSKRYL